VTSPFRNASERRALLAIVAGSLVVRVAFAFVFLRHPVSGIVPMDSDPYQSLGRAIAAGRFGDPGFDYLNPPYAFVLAPLAGLAPERLRVAIATVQILMDAATTVLIAAVARRLFSAPVALGAAALYALYGTAVFYSASVLPVTLSVLSLSLAVAAVLAAADGPPARWLWAGAALGLFFLTRPNGIVLLPVVAWWMWGRSRRPAPLLAAGLAIVLAPFSARSIVNGTGPSPFPVNGGINFYIGNSPEAHGRYAHVPNVTDKPGEQVQTSIAEASRRAGRPLDARGASSFWFQEAFDWMRREPGTAFALTLRKAATFFRAEEPPLNVSYDFAREEIPFLRATIGLGLILPLALLGIGATLADGQRRRDGHGVFLLGVLFAYAASVVAFFLADRYRLPVVPLLAIFAAHGASVVLAQCRSRRPARIALSLAALGAAALFADYPFAALGYDKDGLDHVKLSDVYIGRGDYAAALRECEKARALSAALPDTFFCFATAYYFQKDAFRAEMALRATLDAQAGTSSDVPARRNLAHVLKEQHLYQAALRESDDPAQREAIEAESAVWKRQIGDLAAYARAQLEEARTQRASGQLFEARYALLRALEADPTLAAAQTALADVNEQLHLGGPSSR
jgi:hypothetical protein